VAKHLIEFCIDEDGSVSYEVKGIKGKKCLSVLKFIEEVLGGGVVSSEKTSEYYEEEEKVGVGNWQSNKSD